MTAPNWSGATVPAMWNSAFYDDDKLNGKLADEYGIVMGTSHHEPMMRAQAEWASAGHASADWNYGAGAAAVRTFWQGGITNPLTVIEQITYLMFVRLLDVNESRDENRERRSQAAAAAAKLRDALKRLQAAH